MLKFSLSVLTLFLAATSVLQAADKPNVLWIMSEDNSKHYLKLFDENGAPAPNIEALANDGLAFERAFSNAPVCSVARTTLITSCYGPRIGTEFHRRSKLAAMPDGLKMFPAYLKEAGYYTSNNRKEDYNAVKGEKKEVWDDSSGKATWRNRPKDSPFFHVQTYTFSHESSLHFDEKTYRGEKTQTDPERVKIFDYHPSSPLFRYTTARYHDRMGVIDDAVGELVGQLGEDGLLEDTFIFYFGDHGGVLPRSKGYIYESGLHIPLVVRVPENWKHLVDAKRGSRVKGFVSFIDFGPTVLNLAGVDVPEQVDGKAFLGEGVTMAEVNQRDETYGYADRFDEKYDLCRSVRKGKFKYIRNYQSFYPDGLQNNYRYKMLAYEEWRSLYKEGELNEAQSQFFEAREPEALYDIEADPYEVNNLANDPAYAQKVAELHGKLNDWVKGMPDLSFYPENVLYDKAFDNAVEFGQSHQEEIASLVDVADLSLLPFAEAEPKIEAALKSENPWERYWGLIVCSTFGQTAEPLASTAKGLLGDSQPMVRVRAAEFLGSIHAADPLPTLYDVINKSESEVADLLTFNTVAYLEDMPEGYEFDLSKLTKKWAPKSEVSRRTDYLESK